MTDKQLNDCFAALGRAFAERRDLTRRVAELKAGLKGTAEALATAVENTNYQESITILEQSNDPLQQWEEYRSGVARLGELDKILSG